MMSYKILNTRVSRVKYCVYQGLNTRVYQGLNTRVYQGLNTIIIIIMKLFFSLTELCLAEVPWVQN